MLQGEIFVYTIPDTFPLEFFCKKPFGKGMAQGVTD
jgi:hypothetical protein